MSGHAKRSPSSASRWSICTMSPIEEAGRVDSGSAAAEWGTAAHLVSSTCLESMGMLSPADFLGQSVCGWIHPESDSRGESIFALGEEPALVQEIVWTQEITQEMVDCCNTYVGYVQNLVATTGGELHVEVRVGIEHITGEAGAGGTSDTVILCADEIHVIDLKGGQMRVDAYDDSVDLFDQPVRTPNHQLAMYADGAATMFGRRKTVHLHIVQPRINHLSVHTLPDEDLLAFVDTIRQSTKAEPVYAPSTDRCHFCKASGDCQGQRDAIAAEFLDETGAVRKVTEDKLGSFYDLVPLLEKVLKATEAQVRARLEAGQEVIGKDGPFKLVEGRMGARKWDNATSVEEAVKGMRVKQDMAYNITFKSPAQLEESIKTEMPRNWKKLEAYIVQERTKPRIASAKDPAPALNPLVGFEPTEPAVSGTAN